MKSGNAQLLTQREHSGQTAGKLNALLVIFLTLLGWLLVACGTTEATSATGTRCPDAVQQLVDPKVIPDLEISLAVDGSGSFMGDRTASRAFVAQQVALTVEDAVDKGAALRVIVFAGSAGSARTVVECPVMAVRYHNNRREALMLSDGIALPETVVAVDLSNFSSLGMYGVGQTEPPPSTREVNRLARSWHAWLARQGALQVVVSTQGYSSTMEAVPMEPGP